MILLCVWILVLSTVFRLRCPEETLALLHAHYDAFKHEVSGMDSFGTPFFVNVYILSPLQHFPMKYSRMSSLSLALSIGVTFMGRTSLRKSWSSHRKRWFCASPGQPKTLWRGCPRSLLRKQRPWVSLKGLFKLYFCFTVGSTCFSISPVQKMAQLELDQQVLLRDTCVLWIWVKKKMMLKFDGDVVAKHDELFAQGFFGLFFWGTLGALSTSTYTNLKITNV